MSIRTHTQEDPIGLAGGLNLYGFANGDPINFSDPFGLCVPSNPGCLAVLTQVGRSMPYSTGGSLSNLRPEARADLMRIGLKSGHAVGVYATTEGRHVDPRHNGVSIAAPDADFSGFSGLAVDITEIDGVDVGTNNVAANPEAAGLNAAVSNAALSLPGVRSAIGPGVNSKSQVYGGTRTSGTPRDDHLGHHHISFYRADERQRERQ